jgi:hypothetical protein
MHVDPELLELAKIVAFIVVAGLIAIRRTVWLPSNYNFQLVPAAQLTPQQTEFFRPYDTKLQQIGYFPFATYRITTLKGSNLTRGYLNSTDPAKCTVSMLHAGNKASFTHFVEFDSKYADGTKLITVNSQMSTVFASMPKVVRQQFRNIQDPFELKLRHDLKAQELSSRGVLFFKADTCFDDTQKFHREFCLYQTSRKLLRYDQKAGLYRATVWTGLRGILNFFNPLADNFSITKFAFATLFGAVAPLAALTFRVPVAEHFARSNPVLASLLSLYLPTIAYTLAGAVVGWLFAGKSFIWAMVLGFVPGKLLHVAGASLGWAIWMGLIADIVMRLRGRRRSMALNPANR